MRHLRDDLLRQAAKDFPGGVIYLLENDGETGYIEVTRWDAYPDYSAGFFAYYTFDGTPGCSTPPGSGSPSK